MKKPTELVCVAMVAGLVLGKPASGAEPAASASPVPDIPVGELSRPEALVIEGNETFTREQILKGMALQLDFHLAQHRAAPLVDYTESLERKITLGYERAGFFEPRIKAAVETNSHRILVQVKEGLRYHCGEILLAGFRTMTNEIIQKKIADTLAGFQADKPEETNSSQRIWKPNEPAPFDEFAHEEIVELVQEALRDLDYYQPQVSVRIIPDPARLLADLRIDFADEGIKGKIEEFEVTGLHTNTPAQVLEYLDLKRGMELHAELINTVSNRLWHSARFVHQDVILRPLPETGRFKLALDLEELREAPALNQAFSPEERALLKFHDWLMAWDHRPEDLVLSLNLTGALARVQATVVVSSSGLALAARNLPTNGPPDLAYAVVASTQALAFYSSWRRSKFALKDTEQKLELKVNVTPPASGQQGHISVAAGIGSKGHAFSVQLGLPPVLFISSAHGTNVNVALKDGILSIQLPIIETHAVSKLQIDAATGRLLQYAIEGETLSAHLWSEKGAWPRLLKEIEVATADHPDEYVTNHGLSSWLSFLTTDALESPLTDPFLQWLCEPSGDNRATNSLAILQKVKPFLAEAREVLAKRNIGGVFEPLNRIKFNDPDEDEDEFFVPMGDTSDQRANPVGLICGFVLSRADEIFPRESWPWLLLRETAFTLAGRGKYTQLELDRLLKSEAVGPIGCLATACLLGKVNPKLARTFAERGLSRLKAVELDKDYRVLLETNSVAGQILVNALNLFGSFTGIQTGTPTATRPPEMTDKAMLATLERVLNRFLPQVQFLADSKALFERGLMLISDKSVLRDFDEAAQCFRKAAEQGHAGAQMNLGLLCEQGKGVPKDFAEAMRWYLKAAAQKELHASCHVADLYRYGKGVNVDPDEAAKWYKKEVEEQCTAAQFNLASICEEQRKMPEALTWYRRAAEGADSGPRTAAQAHLGELLSEGFFTTADYVEAWQWLTLAASGGDELSGIRLRRLKAKMTDEQLGEAGKRTEAFEKRLEEKGKKQGK